MKRLGRLLRRGGGIFDYKSDFDVVIIKFL